MAITVSAASKAIIKASIPAVAKAGDSLTRAFYKRMFTNNPELLSTFNMSHQVSGDQPKALFKSIVYAAQSALSDGQNGIPGDAVACIVHKHCSLAITADQYNIVGTNLLATIKEELGVGQDVLDAWGELYGQVAGALIGAEKAEYEKSLANGGWSGTKQFVITGRKHLSEEMVQITLKPKDGSPIPNFTAGQYISLWPTAKQLGSGNAQPRQYSLISSPKDKEFVIIVRLVDGGVVSPWIHTVKVGTEVPVTAPFGPLSIQPGAKKYVFVSTGAGISANLGVMKNLIWATNGAPVHWVYGTVDGQHHPFRASLVHLGRDCPWFHRHVFYSAPKDDDVEGIHFQHRGEVNIETCLKEIGDLKGSQIVLCGFGSKLKAARETLIRNGADPSAVHVELFSSGLNALE